MELEAVKPYYTKQISDESIANAVQGVVSLRGSGTGLNVNHCGLTEEQIRMGGVLTLSCDSLTQKWYVFLKWSAQDGSKTSVGSLLVSDPQGMQCDRAEDISQELNWSCVSSHEWVGNVTTEAHLSKPSGSEHAARGSDIKFRVRPLGDTEAQDVVTAREEEPSLSEREALRIAREKQFNRIHPESKANGYLPSHVPVEYLPSYATMFPSPNQSTSQKAEQQALTIGEELLREEEEEKQRAEKKKAKKKRAKAKEKAKKVKGGVDIAAAEQEVAPGSRSSMEKEDVKGDDEAEEGAKAALDAGHEDLRESCVETPGEGEWEELFHLEEHSPPVDPQPPPCSPQPSTRALTHDHLDHERRPHHADQEVPDHDQLSLNSTGNKAAPIPVSASRMAATASKPPAHEGSHRSSLGKDSDSLSERDSPYLRAVQKNVSTGSLDASTGISTRYRAGTDTSVRGSLAARHPSSPRKPADSLRVPHAADSSSDYEFDLSENDDMPASSSAPGLVSVWSRSPISQYPPVGSSPRGGLPRVPSNEELESMSENDGVDEVCERARDRAILAANHNAATSRQEARLLRGALEDSEREVSRLTGAMEESKRERDRFWRLYTEQSTLNQRMKGADCGGMGLTELTALQVSLEAGLERVRLARTEAEVRSRIEAELSGRKVPDDKLCVVCTENEKEVILLPCKHRCLCQGCADQIGLGLCPMCRAPIEQLIVPF